MTDKITPFPSRPRLATCTGGVPSENPDSGKPTEDMHPDNLRDLAPPRDALLPAPGTPLTDALHALGFGANIPHVVASTRVDVPTLKKLRNCVRAVERELTDIIGDGDDPDDFGGRVA